MPDAPMRRLGDIASFEMGQSPPSSVVVDGDGGVPFLQGCAEFGPRYPQSHCSCLISPKMCKRGDVLISVRAPVGSINKADREYCIGRGLAAVRLSAEYPGDFGWHLLSYWAHNLQRVAQGTTFEAVGRNDLANLEFIDIKPEDREAVVAVLNTADEAIAKTETLIAKLRAIKQGLLHDVLTRGLDKNGELRNPECHPEQFKNSALGPVPRSWDVVPLGSITSSVTSGSRGWAYYYSEQGALFLRMSNLTREHIHMRFDDLQHVDLPSGITEARRTRVSPGDILISITADLGVIGVCPEGLGDAYVNQHIASVKLKTDEVNPQWAGNYLASGPSQRQFQVLNDQGTKAGMNLPTVERLLIARPMMAEEIRIGMVIRAMDQCIWAETAHCVKLTHIKKGLMRDLLTGRVRVPQEIPEGERL